MKAVTQEVIRPFTGRHMAFIMISFFTIVVGVNVTMAILARQSWTGLVVQNSYVASQHFNEETRIREAMLARGYRLMVSTGDGSLSIVLQNDEGRALPIQSANIVLRRSVSAQTETPVVMHCVSESCSTKIDLARGLWRGEAVLQVPDFGVWKQSVEILVRER